MPDADRPDIPDSAAGVDPLSIKFGAERRPIFVAVFGGEEVEADEALDVLPPGIRAFLSIQA